MRAQLLNRDAIGDVLNIEDQADAGGIDLLGLLCHLGPLGCGFVCDGHRFDVTTMCYPTPPAPTRLRRRH